MIGRSLSPFAMQLGSARKGKGVSFLFAILLLAQSMVLVTSEIVDLGLDMIIDASSEEVHFIQGYLRAPATIDLSNIRWISNEQVSFELWDDAATNDYDFEQDDVQDDEFEALETKTDPPIREPEDSSGNNDNAPGEGNEDDGQDEGETTGEENDANDEEQKEDPVIPSEDKINSNEDNEGGNSESEDENPAEPSPSATEPEDKEEGESVETNDTPQGNNEQDEGKDKSEGETANEAQKNNNNSGDNEVEGEEEKEGSADEDDEEAAPPAPEEEEPTPVAPEKEAAPEEEEPTPGAPEKEAAPEKEDPTPVAPEKEEPTPVAPSGDNNDNGGDENDQEEEVSTPVDEQEGESTPAAPSENRNDNEGNKEEQEGESTPAPPTGDQNDNGGDEDEQEEESTPKEDGDTPPPTTQPTSDSTGATIDGGDRRLEDTKIEQVVDIALFIVRPNCAKDEWGNCEWVSIGIGAYDSEMVGGMSYCCNVDTAERGLCKRESIGHMMVDHDKFDKVNGDHRKVKVPSVPLRDFEMEDPLFEVKESGNYFMIIANCDDDGLGVITLGNMEWKSVGGYLPGDMFYLMYFYGATTAVYLVLGLWYYSGMRMFQEAAIPIQKYFLGTIILGFLATGFQGLNLLYWNAAGIRSPAVVWIALALGTLFKASLSCLGVMVAKGWGVVRDTLGLTLCKIILLGLLYSGLALVRDFLQLASSSASLVSSKEQEEFDLALVLTLVIFCINVGFYFWIIYSARATADYLKNMNQTSKLRRHLRLRCLIITSMIISVALTGANAIQAMSGPLFPYAVESIMSLDQVWIIKAVGYANYLFILIGVTILWRPTSDSKDYAMQMQIPSGNEENDLELSCVVPSADDMGMDEGFTIHDAIRT